MPIAIETDEFLRTMLYGGWSLKDDGRPDPARPAQSLVDGAQARIRYALAFNDTMTPDPTYPADKDFINARVPLKTDADARAEALRKALESYLTAIVAGKRHEGLPVIQSVLLKSRAASVVVKALTADTRSPNVVGTTPANGATGVRRNINLTATFSEAMDKTTIDRSTFKLYKVTSAGTTQVTDVTVEPSSDGLGATLDPFGTSATLLAKNTNYKAVVTTGVEDSEGTALDQSPSKAGSQQKVWTFTTGRR